ncbi:MAG: hypothetical protein MRY83_11180, partial [Flavobacteriales bacterium]|nr:hypothetical protein [Flavobacteriales bacterium]
SVYCHCMHQKLSINLKAVYEINYPTGGKYFLLDYNDGKSTFYKDNRSYYRQSCWDGWQVEEPEEEMLRINPFDKAFTEWTKNNAIGGMQKSGYQYFKIQMSSQELQFKKYLGQYFSPHPQFFELYSSSRRDSIILKERHLGTINTIYWIIET